MEFLSIKERKYHNDNILVSTEWLDMNLNSPELVILDLDSQEQYKSGHIRGAVNVDDNYFKTSLEDRTHIQGPDQISETFSKV